MTITVEFRNDRYHQQGEMERWCNENINHNPPYKIWVSGKPRTWEGLGTWCMASAFGTTFFYFKNEKDATAFLLRWS